MNKLVMVALVVIAFGAKGDAEEPVTVYPPTNLLAAYPWTLADRKPVEVLQLMKQQELASEIYPVCVHLADSKFTDEEKRKAMSEYLKVVGLVARKNYDNNGEMPGWVKTVNEAVESRREGWCATARDTADGSDSIHDLRRIEKEHPEVFRLLRRAREQSERSRKER